MIALLMLTTVMQVSPAQAQQDMSFQRALSAMVEQNVSVRVQQTKLSASESQLNAARGAFTPNLFLKAEQQNSDGNGPAGSGFSNYSAARVYSANATWNIFRSGADAAGLRAALFDRSYQNSLLDDSYLQAEDKAARALFDLIMKRKLVEAYRRSEESSRHFLEIAQARFQRSLLSREETDRVALDTANAEARRADAETQYIEAVAAVESLLGHSQVSIEWPWLANLSEDKVKDLLAEKSLNAALESRPDLRAAKEFAESEDYHGRSLFRSMLPSIDLTYTVGETQLHGLNYSSWTTLATLTVPLWSGLKDYSTYRTQVEARYAAEHKMQQVKKDVLSSVEAAQKAFRLSMDQYRSRSKNLRLAKHILEQEDARFKAGRTAANELNQDLARVTTAEVLAIQGIAQAHVAYLQLLHVFGKRVQ